ncbi:DNA-binding protein [uncultured Chloroflexus sp.]|uniref:HEPN domain-containing protein n=1 Tax=uncultured Chloroflexus sp. TaxID=214040 RepID=UPI003456F1E6
MREGISNQVCFHCPQCVKTSLEALIVHQGLVPYRIHKLSDLPSQVNAAPRAAIATTRYPGFTPDVSQSLPNQRDAEEALAIAQHVSAYVTDLVAA